MKRANILLNVNEVNTSNIGGWSVCVLLCVLLKIVSFFQHLIMASGLTIFLKCLNANELSRGSLLMASDYHLINAELRRSWAKLVLSDSWDSDLFHSVLLQAKLTSCCGSVRVQHLMEPISDRIYFIGSWKMTKYLYPKVIWAIFLEMWLFV